MRHLKNVMKSNKKRQIIATFIDIATSDTYILNMNGSLSRCLSRCKGICWSGSKLEDDTADRSQIITAKLGAQFDEQPHLLFVEGFAIRQKIGLDTDTPTVAATDGFNRIRTHEQHNVVPDGFSGNAEFGRQITVCILPSQAQYFQNPLAAFARAHVSTSFHRSLEPIVTGKGQA